jgi:hypothetical protein
MNQTYIPLKMENLFSVVPQKKGYCPSCVSVYEQQTPQKTRDFIFYYSQKNGSAYLGDSLKLLTFIEANCINLIITSSPFALTRKKEYGTKVLRNI